MKPASFSGENKAATRRLVPSLWQRLHLPEGLVLAHGLVRLACTADGPVWTEMCWRIPAAGGVERQKATNDDLSGKCTSHARYDVEAAWMRRYWSLGGEPIHSLENWLSITGSNLILLNFFHFFPLYFRMSSFARLTASTVPLGRHGLSFFGKVGGTKSDIGWCFWRTWWAFLGFENPFKHFLNNLKSVLIVRKH